ncbi:MAG: deoxyribose-phosphate aldolase [Candidatus Sumerlaeaceae bacterium]|nr:deoxyribose-phosphate aldolase [Candidatus Sumerlaeaceae bacterium]
MDEQLIERLVDEVVRRVTAEAVRPAVTGSAPACGCPSATAEATETAARELLGTGACRVGCTDAKSLRCEDLAPYIDHTLLKPGATESEIEKLCDEARRYRFASVCVNTSYTELCARLLAGSGVMVCSVVGFPLGAMSTEAKAFETRDAIRHGADEVDMVINVGKLKSGDFAYVCDDIRAVVQAAAGRTVKVIIETALLTDEEKVAACVLAKAAGAHFVKTSTGFGPGGATAADVALMRRTVGDRMGVKASGGIRDCQTAIQMVESGATRIGASASVAIVKGQESKSSY